jgi:hypothetical protein
MNDQKIETAAIAELRALGQAMLAGASEGDWVTVANLEAVRAAVLRELLEGAARPVPEVLAPLIEEVLAGDRAILALAEPARERASAEILAFRHGRRAQAAYAETGGGER